MRLLLTHSVLLFFLKCLSLIQRSSLSKLRQIRWTSSFCRRTKSAKLLRQKSVKIESVFRYFKSNSSKNSWLTNLNEKFCKTFDGQVIKIVMSSTYWLSTVTITLNFSFCISIYHVYSNAFLLVYFINKRVGGDRYFWRKSHIVMIIKSQNMNIYNQ